MPSLVIELCRRCDGRFLARIVRYLKDQPKYACHWEVIYVSQDCETQEEAVLECQHRAERKRWGQTRVADGIEDLPENIEMMRSRVNGKVRYKRLEIGVYRDPQMHIHFQKVH